MINEEANKSWAIRTYTDELLNFIIFTGCMYNLIDDENFDEIAVSGGFVEFSDNTLSVVASAAERKETIDVSRAERAKQRAEKRIEEAKNENNDIDLRRAEVSLRRAINRLNISKH